MFYVRIGMSNKNIKKLSKIYYENRQQGIGKLEKEAFPEGHPMDNLLVNMPCYYRDHTNTYPWTFVSAAVEKVRDADCRATALLAKRATVVRIMVNAFQFSERENHTVLQQQNQRTSTKARSQNFYD
jgi:hypothetical protein